MQIVGFPMRWLIYCRFVEKYFEMKDDMKHKGASSDELFEAVTRSLKLSGINLRVKVDDRNSCKYTTTSL